MLYLISLYNFSSVSFPMMMIAVMIFEFCTSMTISESCGAKSKIFIFLTSFCNSSKYLEYDKLPQQNEFCKQIASLKLVICLPQVIKQILLAVTMLWRKI